MPVPGTTAVLVLLPDADPLLEAAAQLDTRVVRPGVPAHATLLYPWLPADQVGAGELRRLRAALAVAAPEGGPLSLRLTEVEGDGGFIGIPVPELRPLATAVRTTFPQQVPYEGRFGSDPAVHLTVSLDAAADTAAAIARRVTEHLPIVTEVSAVHVVALAPEGWQELAALPLTS
ncbi:2'-5' RNA ligase family protein [Streptomyces sp. NPDC055060]